MRSRNSKPIDRDEAEHLALVKQCGCVFCEYRGMTEAHHPKGCQGLHFCTVSACPTCHAARAWTFCGMSELAAINETNRRVALLRNGRAIPAHAAHRSRQNGARSPSKQLPRAA
jgi:hypothetical protein